METGRRCLLTTPQETPYRHPRTIDRDPDREGCQGHPGYGRHKSVLWRLTEQFKADAQACAQAEGYVRQGQDGEEAAMNDWLNNVLAERVYGKANQVGLLGVSPVQSTNASTAQPLPETSKGLPPLDVSRPDLGASIDLALCQVDLWEIADLSIKEVTSQRAFEKRLIERPELLTLDDMEREEDKYLEEIYEWQKEQAKEKATTTPADPLSGRPARINDARYAEEIRSAREKKQRQDQERPAFRAKRHAQLLALLAPALLRQPGNPRLQRQDALPSAFNPNPFGVTQRDRLDAAEACREDDSS